MLLALLLAGHFTGDWIVQSDWQAASKVCPTEVVDGVTVPLGYLAAGYWRSWKANQQHMLGYHICLGAGALAAGLAWWQWVIVVVVSWATHSLIDRRWPVVWVCDRTASHAFGQTMFGVIAVDQAMHLTILCLLSAVL